MTHRNQSVRSYARPLAAFAVGIFMLVACTQPVEDSDDEDDGPSSGAGAGTTGPGSGAGAGPGSCQGDEIYCSDASTVMVCEAGQGQAYECGTACQSLGYYSDGCFEDQCQCGDPSNPVCLDGVAGFCVCAESVGESCGGNEAAYYEGCHAGDPEITPTFTCFASYVSGDTIDCAGAIEGCL